MKKLLYLILLTLITKFSDGKSLSNLDRKFGINRFKLESSYDLYKSKLTFKFVGDDKVKYYIYSGSDMTMLFGVKIYEIALGFYKSKLYTISYSFKPTTDFNENIILNKLKDLFGKPIMGNDNKIGLDYQWGYMWITNKTYLQHSKYAETSEYQPNYLDIFMYSIKMKHQVDNDNF